MQRTTMEMQSETLEVQNKTYEGGEFEWESS